MNPYRRLHAGSLTRQALAGATLLSIAGGLVLAAPVRAATFAVTKTADTNDGACDSDCSLREAITAANASPGADTIIVPAGTYVLTLANAGGVNEDANATGDLDVLDGLTIQGAGSASTIIEAGTTNANGIDKVLALNPICTTAFNVTIDGVTVRNGRNSQPGGAADFSFTGGGIDWCSAGAGGTFTLSNSVVSDNTNVNGYGGGLNVDTVSSPTTVNISNVTFSNNQTLSTTLTATGGAINLFGDSPTVTITNSTFSGNHTVGATTGGGAIYFRPTTVGHLTITGSTFSSNTAGGIGGAIATDSHGVASTISIGSSAFSGNTATNSFGGALDLGATNLNTTPFSLTHLTITGNSAGISGGGVYVGQANVAMSKSLIVGNAAPSGSGIHKSVDAGVATVTDNWWGCSTGPSAAPCDTETTSGGTLSFTPWYRDQLTATTSPIVTNQSTALTASFLTDSASGAVPAADVAEVVGRSVTWAATNGSLSSTQATVQAAGTATGSFQATAAGTATISAKVDHDNTSPVSSNVLSLTVNKANTTAAITNAATLSGTNSVTGQPVAVTYSVTGAFGNTPTAPTGNVTVSDGSNSCTATAAAGTCTIIFATAGSKSITATYAGDANFNPSSASAAASHTVDKAATTTTITSDSPDPSNVGQTVSVGFTVAATAPGAGTASGNVTVSDGVASCTGTVAGGSCDITLTTSGARTLTATYAGDSNFNGSTSAGEPHAVNALSTTTTITSDSPDPSVVGQSVTVQFAVTGASGTPTGNVTVSDGTISCTGTVAAGQCSLTFTGAGAKSLTAAYGGNSNFNGSTSAAEPHQVQAAATTTTTTTTTTITSDSPDPSVVGQSVTVQFAVTGASGTPTGNVTVSDGTISCTATVAAGQCSLTFTSAGAKSLTATYAGGSTYSGSISAAEAHLVNQAKTVTSVTSDTPDPSTQGSAVTVHYAVSVSAPGAGTPTGNVTVSDGVSSCTGTVAAGQCSITLSTGGSRTLTATYAGDPNFNGSTSAAEPHGVNPPNTAPTATVTNGACSSTNMASGSITLTLFDADGDPMTLTLTGNSNTVLVRNASVLIGGSGGIRTIKVSAVAKKSGTATLTFAQSDGKVTVPIVVTVKVGTDKNETINGTSGIDMLFGLGGNNTINGNAGSDLLCGGNSRDTLNGGSGNDILDGENGDDALKGGSGNDILRGSSGNDTLTGGLGADSFSGGSGRDINVDFNPGQGDKRDGS